MKILLTGATGFLGSHITKKLVENGHEVFIIKRSFSDTSRISSVLNNIKFFDIDSVALSDIFFANRFEVVIHMATNYGRKGETGIQLLEDNLLFPLNLLSESIKSGVYKFINIDTLLNKFTSSYSLSKKQFVEWGNFYSRNNVINFTNVKIEHLYGPGDDDNKFIYWLINKMVSNVDNINLTEGIQKRDFIFIDDVVNALILIVNIKEIKHKEFEIGTGSTISIREFIDLLKDEIERQSGKKIISKLNFGALPYRENEQLEVNVNLNNIIEIGWHHKIQLKEGIKYIVKEIIKK